MKKTRSFLLAVAIAAMAFTFSCSGGGGEEGEEGGGSAFDGTWDSADGEKVVLSNNAFTVSEGNIEILKGTYAASGNNITMAITQVKGSALGDDASDIGLSASQWYTRQSMKTAIMNYLVGAGLTQAEAEAAYNQEMEPLAAQLFGTITGTLNGNTLTITAYGEISTFTKQGGTTNPGGGGGDRSIVGTYYHLTISSWYLTINSNGTYKGVKGDEVYTGTYTVSGSSLLLSPAFANWANWSIIDNMYLDGIWLTDESGVYWKK